MGYDCPSINEDNRKLVFTNERNGVSYLLVKPSDVAIYVEHGAADVGVVGKDVLLEGGNDVYELMDLHLGKCRMAVAAPNDYADDPNGILRVATKYPNIAKNYYRSLNREFDIIKLNGSSERKEGDAALTDYAWQFDHCRLDALEVSDEEIQAAFERTDKEFIKTLEMAAQNLRALHSRQNRKNFMINDQEGVVLGQMVMPFEKVGL